VYDDMHLWTEIDLELRRRRARAYAKQGLLGKAAADKTAADKLAPTKVGH
jgi:hypothetical protein